MKKIILDIECYRDFFLLAFYNMDSGGTLTIRRTADQPFDAVTALNVMGKNTTISFNGLGYDLPLIVLACSGASNEELKDFSDKLVKSQKSWEVIRNAQIVIPDWDHIDIMQVCPGQASLKTYGGRIHADKLQDLPYSPDTRLNAEEMDEVEKYCLNDLALTAKLYQTLLPQIELREKMGEQYGLDLRSKGDAQIAEAVLKHELEAIGVRITRPAIKSGSTFRYEAPSWVKFDDQHLQNLLQDALSTDFKIQPSGSVAIPEKLARKVPFDGAEYTVGIGGLHSNETGTSVRCGTDDALFDVDFASYYPSIILGERYYPRHLGEEFLKIYRSIVKRRLKAKSEGDTVTANSLKIVVNASFGKFGNKYSFLYSPNLLIHVTLTGQLALLMLIERITQAGGKAISANTDGVVILCPQTAINAVRSAMFGFELISGFELEETHYKAIHIESVNNYMAVKVNGSVKGKGTFAETGMMKNPTFPICSEAAREYVSQGIDVEQYVMGCADIRKFLSLRKVTGGATWDGEHIGKVVRWYVSNNGKAQPILYATSGNKVPKTDRAVPLMDLGIDSVPSDLDRSYYLAETKKMLERAGVQCSKKRLNFHL